MLDQYQILQGVIEDVKSDPLKHGRVKVRIFNFHSEKKELAGERGIPTEDLPWATVMLPVSEGSISGIGFSPHALCNGTEVILLARDEMMQDLVVIGVIPGIHQEPAKPAEGFYDPDGTYPLEDRLKEPDTNRLARKEKLDETILKSKTDRVNKTIPMAFGGDWTEPLPIEYIKSEYPNNKVRETTSGHVSEIDDTEGFEGIRTWHKSGAFDDITQDGERIIKCPSNFYLTIEENHCNLYVKNGGVHITATDDILIKTDGIFGVEAAKGIKLTASEGSLDVDASNMINFDSPIIRSNT